ncbi:TonB-dependent receptor [Arenicella xantha]|uniref:Iron complex outermembrane receptor protein n=1 Tax=Arenicella xantha TaxID=644221 RepID=A0A395JHX8_9GAMM|nr:TonB-dependent receptor [Arenicella xantha]RBP49737.1 iron complex outermembrane receptor protein [Arenicella xantha]
MKVTNRLKTALDKQQASSAGVFYRTTLSACIAAAIAGVSAPQAFAQSDASSDAVDNVLEEVVVTGFRASIRDSIDQKRFSNVVVESISAEDIGKLPDSSIAESIARLPGLAAQRLDGRASSISVRGFNEDFSTTTFNGREQVSIDDNRGVQFDLYPSEIMSAVTVYKTPTASLVNQGIAGTIDLQTVRPLDRTESVAAINISAEQNSLKNLNADGEDTGYRGTFSYIDQFADNTVGVALALSTFESPNNEERWNAWGYPTDDAGNSVLGGAKPFVRSSNLQRDTFMGVVQFQPNEALSITADALYIDFLDEKILRGIEIPGAIWGGGFGTVYTPGTIDNGFVTSGTLSNVMGVVRNDFEQRDATLKNFGVNIEYALSDSLTLEVDASSSQTERTVWSLESYSGTGRGTGVGATDTLGFTMDGQEGVTFTNQLNYADPALIQLGGPLSWGNGNTVPADGQDGFINIPEVDDELSAFRIDLSKDFDQGFLTQVSVGLNYTDRTKEKRDAGFFLTLRDYPNRSGVPSGYEVAPTSLEFLGLGSMLSYDSFGLYNDGFYVETDESLTSNNRLINSWSVTEKITTAFIQADFATELAGMPLTGNLGLQYVDTDQSSRGNAVTSENGFAVATPREAGANYDHTLPSLNMSLELSDNQKLRLGLARTISRSRMDRMNSGFGYNFNSALNAVGLPPFSAEGGNPELRPNEADQFDLSYEWYFSDEGYVAVAYFYKDLKTWQEQTEILEDFSGIIPPGADGVVNNTGGVVKAWVDTTTGSIDGFELTGVLPGNVISEALDGFGVSVSASFLDSSLDSAIDGGPIVVPGLSEEIINATVFYEKNGFSARASVRDRQDFLGERFGISFSREFTTVEGATIWDAQVGYDFGEAGIEALEGLALSFQAQNLTDEPYSTINGDGFVTDFQRYGRTYLINARYKF